MRSCIHTDSLQPHETQLLFDAHSRLLTKPQKCRDQAQKKKTAKETSLAIFIHALGGWRLLNHSCNTLIYIENINAVFVIIPPFVPHYLKQ